MKNCLLLLSVLLMVASCTKKEAAQTKQEILRANKWSIDNEKLTYYNSVGGDSDSYNWGLPPNDTKPDCIKDDVIEFKDNYDGIHNTGGDKCKTSETDQIQFKWGVMANEKHENDKKMYIYGLYSLLGQDANGDVEFQDDKVIFSYPRQIPNGSGTITVKWTITFKRK
ncbi:MAG: hypothetical protein JST82_02365 [Bacteroidetes bacterium]|nr:hypothetical protein [Bacteroidota bacterium]